MLAGWLQRRRALRDARYEARLATERAKAHLAPYRAKAEIEWDLKWASPLDKTWRDEIIIILMAIPIVGMFVPGLREPILEGFRLLHGFDANAPTLFLYGWAIIFATTFGIKQGKSLFMPGRLAGLVAAMGKVPDDVPDQAVNPETEHQ